MSICISVSCAKYASGQVSDFMYLFKAVIPVAHLSIQPDTDKPYFARRPDAARRGSHLAGRLVSRQSRGRGDVPLLPWAWADFSQVAWAGDIDSAGEGVITGVSWVSRAGGRAGGLGASLGCARAVTHLRGLGFMKGRCLFSVFL